MLLSKYRLPYSDTYTEIRHDGSPLILHSISELQGVKGFVIAPFHVSEDTPLVVIPAEGAHIAELPCQDNSVSAEGSLKDAGTHALSSDTVPAIAPMSEAYKLDFERFHNAIASGRFAKLVLARTSRQTLPTDDLDTLFRHYCSAYPRAMVMLFSTPQTGTWLMATPEILLDKEKSLYHTMALAGTMPYDEGLPLWSDKNKHEQNIVEQFIERTIAPFASQVIKDGPHTVRAGNLVHLRTDFRFHLKDERGVADVLSQLHPTPAVNGLPRCEATVFVLNNESIQRRYYSGFAGPLDLCGETHLYVSLRCMSIDGNQCCVYAGGGIMPESVAEDEWRETELKLISHV